MRVGIIQIVLVVASLIWAPSEARATSILYATAGQSGADSLLVLDPLTGGISSTIGNIGFSVTGLAMNPVTGVLYGITSSLSASPRSLITINTATGAGTLIGATGVALSDIAFSPTGVLYGGGRSGFGTINLAGGAFTAITTVFPMGGITFDAAGTLYYSGTLSNLSTVNPLTGAILSGQATGLTGEVTAALAFNPDTGLVYGVDRPTGNSSLFRMTAPASFIGGPGSPLDAIAFSVSTTTVPEPTTLLLFGTGLAAAGIRRYRRKK